MNATQGAAFLNPDPIWHISLDAPPAGPPVPAGDLLLVATQESGPSAHPATLYALDPRDGSARWQQTFEYALISGLASSPPLILVSTTSTDLIRGEGTLVALNASGEKLCRWTPSVQRLSTPAVAGDTDTVYVTADTRSLLAINLVTGEEQDQVPLEASASLSAPALADEVIYVPCRGPHLLAVELDGQPRWRFDATGTPDAWLDDTPVVVGERLFATLTGGTVVALRAADGSLAWRVKVGPTGKSLSAPATDGERLFVGARDGLYALDLTDGQRAWAFATQRRIEAAPVVAGGVVYATCHDHHLYAIEAATGQELWRYEVERRIEAPPVLADCGEPARPCVLVIDRGGTLTAIARPLSAEEHEAAGHWVAAAELWRILDRPLKQAEALERYAQSLTEQPCSDEERAAAWTAAAHAFEIEGEAEHAAACQHEIARCLQQPIIVMDVEHQGLVLNTWSRLQFIVHNQGYGPARNLVIRASGDQFEGQVMHTRRIVTLRAGRSHTATLDICPREPGDSVPLRVRAEYHDLAGEMCSREQTIHIAVARTKTTRREEQHTNVFSVTTSGEEMIKILFLAANPTDTTRLRLGEESRAIDQALRQTEFRDRFDIAQHWAVRAADLQGYLLRHQPDIVHFSGHGGPSSEIILEDNAGNSHPVAIRALSTLFSVLKDNVRCVVLNACFSKQQAEAIAEHIDCVVGMSTAIGDTAAISFAAAFYQALGYGRDVKTAFELGRVQIDLENLDEQDTPQLLAVKSDPAKIRFV